MSIKVGSEKQPLLEASSSGDITEASNSKTDMDNESRSSTERLLKDDDTPSKTASRSSEESLPQTPNPSDDVFKKDEPNISKKKPKRSQSWYMAINPSPKQKNETFHKIFKDVSTTEILLLDYTCALVKDILVQGRMYLTQSHVCFHSNILRWQKATTIDFRSIEFIKKEKTMKVIPNAIQLGSKARSFFFTSFTQRDKVYEQLIKLWKNSKKEQPATGEELLNDIRESGSLTLSISSDEYESELHSNEKVIEDKSVNVKAPTASNIADNRESSSDTSNCSGKSSQDIRRRLSTSESGHNELLTEHSEADVWSGPVEHAKEDLQRVYLNREFPLPANRLFETLFGDECDFFKEYLEGKGSYDVCVEKWRDQSNQRRRVLTYCLALTNPLGPKSGNVEETQILYEKSEFGRRYVVDCVAQVFAVPYADYFASVMRYSVRSVGPSASELRVSAEIKYHKSPFSLVKNFLEKNIQGGMKENFDLLEKELEKYFDQNPQSAVLARGRGKKGKKTRKRKKKRAYSSCEEEVSENKNSHDPHSSSNDRKVSPSIIKKHSNVPELKPFHVEETPQHQNLLVWLLLVLAVFLLWNTYRMESRVRNLESKFITAEYGGEMISQSRHFDDPSIEIKVHLSTITRLIRSHVTEYEKTWRLIMTEWNQLKNSINLILMES